MGLSGSRFDVNSCLSTCKVQSEIRIPPILVKEEAAPWSEWYWSPQILDLFVIWGPGFVTSNLLFSMDWGGRLQAHSHWDNNNKSGFDSQMKVLKRMMWRIEPRQTQHLTLMLQPKLFFFSLSLFSDSLCSSGNMIFSCPQSVWNTGQPCNCSVNLSCRATPLFPILQALLFTRHQIPLQDQADPPWIHYHYMMSAIAEEISCYSIICFVSFMELTGLI